MSKEYESVSDLIKQALIALMVDKPYMDITVTDVVNKAGVARVSFYRNFNSISDVLDSFVGDLNKEFLHMLPTLLENDERQWRDYLFMFLYKIANAQKKISKMSLPNISIIMAKFENKIQQLEKENLMRFTNEEKYKVIGKFGFINIIAKTWLKEGLKETPEEIVNYIMSVITKF